MQEENPRGKFGPIFARVTAISIFVSDVFDGERGGGREGIRAAPVKVLEWFQPRLPLM